MSLPQLDDGAVVTLTRTGGQLEVIDLGQVERRHRNRPVRPVPATVEADTGQITRHRVIVAPASADRRSSDA
jgi:hypothetical protein